MKNWLIKLSIPVFLYSVYSGCSSIGSLSEADENLSMNRSYQQEQLWKGVESDVRSAESYLDYRPAWNQPIPHKIGKVTTYTTIRHPARYPDCSDSKDKIRTTADHIEDILKRSNRPSRISDELRSIGESLPDQNNLKRYNGQKVNDDTFGTERQELLQIADKAEAVARQYHSEVPEDLLSAKRRAGFGLLASIIGLIGSSLAGIRGYTKREI